jgi:microcystin-dependent protein
VVLNGQSLVRTGIYANLFAVIGTTYGAADGSHFSVPSVQTRTIRGVGSGYPLAATGGADSTSITPNDSQLPIHSHGNTVLIGGTPVTTEVVVYDPESTIQTINSGGAFGVSYTVTPSIEVSIDNAGSGEAIPINLVNKYIVLTPIIKL